MRKQKNGRIVIADDNKEICELVVDVLAQSGYETDSVHDGYELLTYLKTNDPAVIILDLMMPAKDGITILGTIKQVAPHSRIIIYTGYSEYENSVYARTADKFMVKGVPVEQLVQAVEEIA